jgi:hypothetical protein
MMCVKDSILIFVLELLIKPVNIETEYCCYMYLLDIVRTEPRPPANINHDVHCNHSR